MGLAPVQVHAENHRRPVLGLGAAGAGLDVHVAVALVMLLGEHAAELELPEDLLEAPELLGCLIEGRLVVILLRHVAEQLHILAAFLKFLDAAGDFLELGALLSELLCLLWIVPYLWSFKEACYFLKPLELAVVVKDTPSLNLSLP